MNLYKKNIYPFYHTVSNSDLPYIRNLYPLKSVDQFERELDFFQKNYQNISLKDLMALQKSGQLKDNNFFHLSFDDGLKECSGIIAPILKERNLDATFFINPNFVGNRAIFYRYKVALLIEKLPNRKKELLQLTIHDETKINELIVKHEINLCNLDIYMNLDEIVQLKNDGFSIGAHSMNHPFYADIPFDQQLLETNESLTWVEKCLNLDYRTFSFPFSDLSVKKQFFEEIDLDLSFGTAGIKDDEIATHLQRLPMDDNTGSVSLFVRKHLTLYHIKKLINKNLRTHV